MAMPSKQFRAKTLMFIRGPQPRGWRKEAGMGGLCWGWGRETVTVDACQQTALVVSRIMANRVLPVPATVPELDVRDGYLGEKAISGTDNGAEEKGGYPRGVRVGGKGCEDGAGGRKGE